MSHRRRRVLGVAIGVVAAAGIAGFLSSRTSPPRPLLPGSGELVVYQTTAGGHPIWIEGSRGYLRLTSAGDGRRGTTAYASPRSPTAPVYVRALRPGRYTIESWQRPCDGNCDVLGPSTGGCRVVVTLPAARRTLVQVSLLSVSRCRIARIATHHAGAA